MTHSLLSTAAHLHSDARRSRCLASGLGVLLLVLQVPDGLPGSAAAGPDLSLLTATAIRSLFYTKSTRTTAEDNTSTNEFT